MEDVVVSQPSDTASSDISSITSDVFAELSADSQPASETTESTQPPTEAAPTAPQVATETAPAPNTAGEERASAPIPPDRHKAILETERVKREQVETRLNAIESDVLKPMQTDPVGWLVDSFAEVLNDPRFASDPRLKSFAGRQLGTRTTAPTSATAEDVPMPDITPLVDGAGNKVYAVEDVQALLKHTRESVLRQVKQELAPLDELRTERAQEKELVKAREVVTKVAQQATSIMAEYRKAPGWTTELEPAVKARFNELRQQGQSPESALSFAYQQIVVPTLSHKERAAVVSSLQAKTQTSPITSRSVSTPAKTGPQDTREITRQVFAELSGA